MHVAIRRILTTLAVSSCLTTAAAGQQAAAPQPVTVFSDVLSGRGEFATVVLAGQTAYRLEVIPAGAVIGIRPVLLGLRQPMFTSTMENPVEAAGGASYLVVPAESGEYRIEARYNGEVRLRLVRDPREQALLEGRARSAWYKLTIGIHYVAFVGSVPVKDGFALDDPHGLEYCLGVVEGAVPFASRLHGCAFTVAALSTSDGGDLTMYGFAPRWHLLGGNAVALDIAADVGFASKMETVSVGIAVRARPMLGPIEVEAVPEVAWVRRDGYTSYGGTTTRTEYPAVTEFLPRLAAGLRLRF